MSVQQRHRDVAAYALGVLEPADAFGFEEHLTECITCTVQLSDFAFVTATLAELVSPDRIDVRPSRRLLDRLSDEVAALRRRSDRRRLRLIAAAAALILALSAALVLQGSESAAGQQITAKDVATGVSASVTTEDQIWGTAVSLRLTGLTGPGTCRLIAIGKDGIEHPVLSWTVPTSGYRLAGSPSQEKPLDLQGGTDLPSSDISRWEVRSADGRLLVTLQGRRPPVHPEGRKAARRGRYFSSLERLRSASGLPPV
jgi:hypothetical protein